MVTEGTSKWQPDWSVPPGEVLLEVLQERGLTQAELARRIDRPMKTVNEIVNGKAAVTPETALQLERVLGTPARLWVNLEANYREHQARERQTLAFQSAIPWAKEFPIRELRRYDLISGDVEGAALVSSVLTFFGVATIEAFERHWLEQEAAFRASGAFATAPKAVAAWLRWGEVMEAFIDREQFVAANLMALSRCVRTLTSLIPFAAALERTQKACARYGVALVVLPEFPGIHMSGAAYWTKRGPVIQLSFRYRTTDQFWFSLFHEIGHVRSSHGRPFLDQTLGTSDRALPDEREADRFASEQLLPSKSYEAFAAAGDFTEASVRAFALALDTDPGVVVGRLQHDKLIPYSRLSHLKTRIEWSTTITTGTLQRPRPRA